MHNDVFLDVEWMGPTLHNGEHTGPAAFQASRINIKLRYDFAPKTAENFRQLCTGERGFGYEGSPFHRVIPNFVVQGGDITRGDGTGGRSIYGKKFADENFNLRFSHAGQLAMANSGPDTNNSQFFITTFMNPWLNGHHVIFGEVADKQSMNVVGAIEATGSASGDVYYYPKPTIVRSGMLEKETS